MPNSGDIKSLVIGIKAIRIIPTLIHYNKLLHFDSTRISVERLLDFHVMELQNTLENILV